MRRSLFRYFLYITSMASFLTILYIAGISPLTLI